MQALRVWLMAWRDCCARLQRLRRTVTPPCPDELEWIADHRFTGTYGPGYMWHRDMPPLFDEYWEPFWSVCEERNIARAAEREAIVPSAISKRIVAIEEDGGWSIRDRGPNEIGIVSWAPPEPAP